MFLNTADYLQFKVWQKKKSRTNYFYPSKSCEKQAELSRPSPCFLIKYRCRTYRGFFKVKVWLCTIQSLIACWNDRNIFTATLYRLFSRRKQTMKLNTKDIILSLATKLFNFSHIIQLKYLSILTQFWLVFVLFGSV